MGYGNPLADVIDERQRQIEKWGEQHHSIADSLNENARRLCGIDPANETPQCRRVLQTDTTRSVRESVWIRQLKFAIDRVLADAPATPFIHVPDVRFPNEGEWIWTMGGHV